MAQRQSTEPSGLEDESYGFGPSRKQERPAERTIARLVEAGAEHGERLPRDKLIDLAHRIYDMRRGRAGFFQNSLLGEPVWDMLLALFCLPATKYRKLSVSGLAEAAGLPLTTGLRWSRLMEQKGLIERSPDPLDARRIYLGLSEKGERLMCDYLSSVYHRVVGE